jgi:hypothetical protein
MGSSCCGGGCGETYAQSASTSDATAPQDTLVGYGKPMWGGATATTPVTLGAKLDEFDRRADDAFDWLVAFLEAHRDEIITVARARRITGHHVHGQDGMYDYTRGLLTKEVVEECSDALNYSVRRLSLG